MDGFHLMNGSWILSIAKLGRVLRHASTGYRLEILAIAVLPNRA